MNQDVNSGYARCNLSLLDEQPNLDDVVNDDDDSGDDDDQQNSAQFWVHIIVAAAWFPGEFDIEKEVHHVNHNPLHNHYSNLKWLSHGEHAEIRRRDDREHTHQFKKKKLKSVYSLCLEDIIESDAYQCECKKFFCGVHRSLIKLAASITLSVTTKKPSRQPDSEIVDHINRTTRALNQAENLQFVTQQQNVVFGSGCPAVAISNETREVEIFNCIEDLVEMFNQMYPNLKSIMKTETEWDGGNHNFYRDDSIKPK